MKSILLYPKIDKIMYIYYASCTDMDMFAGEPGVGDGVVVVVVVINLTQ